MEKIKLFLDLDNTVTNSTRAFCSTFNHLYKYKEGFVPAQWDKVEKYNFSCQCNLLKTQRDVLEIFEDPIFFKKLRLINDNTYEIVRKLSEKYQIIVTSIGTPRNLARKTEYLEENLPFIKDYILLNNGNSKMDKSVVQMSEGILLDDVASNLLSSNATRKICFGKIYEWNADWDGERCFDWTEVEKELL